MKIGIDLDGVVYDMIGPFDNFLKSKGITPKEKEYDRGLEKEIIRGYFQEFSKTRPFLNIPLMDGSAEAINELYKNNTIHIVTHRDWCIGGVQDTVFRLAKDKIPFDYISFTKKKSDKAKQFGLNAFVEDSIVNARYIKERSDAFVYLIDRPYNQSDKEDRICRVKNLKEVVSSIGDSWRYM